MPRKYKKRMGRPQKLETRLKISKKMSGKKNHNFGKQHSEEAKQKMREAWAKRKEQKI